MEWPVIVQGALGSALFYVVLEVGQRAVGKITAKVGKEKNVAMWFSLAAYVSKDKQSQVGLRIISMYGALHYVVKALLMMAMAYVASLVLDVFAVVGYVAGIYFLFRSLSYVPHFSRFGNKEKAKEMFLKISGDLGCPIKKESVSPQEE